MLDFNNILSFLSPYSGQKDYLPWVFFSIILALFLWTWVSFKRNAKEENWEKNWQKYQLDIEQGTISELSQSVATESENRADAMPGIILIIGLLGTFIGLGLALDNASNILTSSDMNDMNNSMADLMKMMEGLGTKFKTSTWGLIAFILLKALSATNGYDVRRLNWASKKIKGILEENRQKHKAELEKERANLLGEISLFSQKVKEQKSEDMLANKTFNSQLVSSIEKSFSNLNNFLKNSQEENSNLLKELFTQQTKINKEGYYLIKDANSNSHSSLSKTISNLFEKLITNQEKLNAENATLLKNISQEQAQLFDQQHVELKDVTNLMSSSISQTFENSISDLLAQQLAHTNANQESLVEMANKICRSIEQQQKATIDAVNKNTEFLDKTAQESEKTRGAMDKFVTESLTTIENLKESASGMSTAAKDMGESADKLQTVIDTLSVEMKELMATMKIDLNNTIKNMNESFQDNMGLMTNNLNQTIGDMNDNFKANMTEMSEGLGCATKDISQAVNSLSKSVKDTMDNVQKTITESMDIQKNAQVEFIKTSDVLTENIEGMTTLVNKLTGSIESGLRAVSDSNRQIISLNKKYNTSSDKVEDLVNIVKQTLENTKNNNRTLEPLLSEISHKIPNNQQIIENIAKIQTLCQNLEGILYSVLAGQKKQIDAQLNITAKNREISEV